LARAWGALTGAGVVTAAWLQLEAPADDAMLALYVVGLALLPALARRWWTQALAFAGALALALGVAFDVAPWAATARVADGFLAFYDVRVPVDPSAQPEMAAVILLAAFAFSAAIALAVRARRAVAATAILLVGAGWPVTLRGGGLLWGALILASALVVLARRPRAAVLGLAVVAVAFAASTSAAVDRGAGLRWQTWDFYDRAAKPVGVDYVWNSSYDGISFPKSKTTVLRIRSGPARAYWRATTLDTFDGDRWIEDTKIRIDPTYANGDATLTSDPLLPARAKQRRRWRKQVVEVVALRDEHLVGAGSPVAYRAPELDVRYGWGGVAHTRAVLPQGFEYTVWSYAPRPTARALARVPAVYPAEIRRPGYYLRAARWASVPAFGQRGRDRAVAAQMREGFLPRAYAPLWRTARRVVGNPTSPYAAVVALETWFRESGGFTYDEHPVTPAGVPALVDFVTRGKRGYCQHFAGAMALMLRYLGIPARIGAGFTSGLYDVTSRTWKVTDHDAHTWVEVWFRGYGWLPFDPTPLRGELDASYTASSGNFAAPDVLALLDRGGAASRLLRKERLEARRAQASGGASDRASAGRSAVAVLALLAIAALGLVALAKEVRRRARYLGGDARAVARACRSELLGFLGDQGVRVPPSATAHEVARLVEARFGARADRFADAVTAARFGSGDPRLARRELRDLVSRLRARLPLRRRVRGLLSLRSLA
jgi:hypothetical protein